MEEMMWSEIAINLIGQVFNLKQENLTRSVSQCSNVLYSKIWYWTDTQYIADGDIK